MTITDIKIRKLFDDGPMKAIVSVTLDDAFVIHDVKVVDGQKVPFTEEPEIWFHDLFRQDGTPWIREEVDFIKSMTADKNLNR